MMQKSPPRLICVTGGAATGKSTVTQLLATTLQAQVFSADEAVHNLLAGDPAIIHAVRGKFPTAWREDHLIRPELARLVFDDIRNRKFLEALLHPRVYDLCDHAWCAARRNESDFIAEIPLLFEGGEEARFPVVVVVAASPDVQMERLQRIRNLETQRARRMLAAQWSNEQKMERSHFVIWNDGSLQVLEDQVRRVAMQLQPVASL